MHRPDFHSIAQQIKRNTVALISIMVAITALSYNTWRNERTEQNRNMRAAGFEILTELAELQLVADLRHYDQDAEMGNPIRGWAHVLLIRDLSYIMPPYVREGAESLYKTWGAEWSGLGRKSESAKRITDAIQSDREAVLKALKSLD